MLWVAVSGISEKDGGGVLLAALANLADEGLRANVFRGNPLEEAVFDRIAEWWSPDTLAVGDGGVNALLHTRADHLPLGIGEHHHHIQHHLGHPIILTDRTDGLIHEVDIDVLLAEVLDEASEVGERTSEAVEFVGDHHVVLGDMLAETLVFAPRGGGSALAEVAVPVDLVVLLVGILLADLKSSR